MMIQWKVYQATTLEDLEQRLNALALEDYDIYRVELLNSYSESGTLPVAQQQPPSNVYVYPSGTGYIPPQQTFQTTTAGYTHANYSKTRTHIGQWIIIAYRVES